MLTFLFILVFAYLLGSIPTGYLIFKAKKGADIRKAGSKAIGGTNVARLLGSRWGIVVAVIDVLKGIIPAYLAVKFLSSDWQIIIIVIAVTLGHVFPVWLNFKGGKGVATFSGSLIVLFGWKIFLLLLLCWIAVLWILRIMSLTNLILALFLPFVFWIFSFSFPYIIFGIMSAGILWYSHKENVQRLVKGKESTVNFKF